MDEPMDEPMDGDHPQLLHTVLDATDARALAEFYRELLGLAYRAGDEPPDDGAGETDAADWLVLVRPDDGSRVIAVQLVETLPATNWPDPPGVPMQLHLDFTVRDRDQLERHRRRAEELGATLRLDRTDDVEEPLYVLADPAGHPFCLFVG